MLASPSFPNRRNARPVGSNTNIRFRPASHVPRPVANTTGEKIPKCTSTSPSAATPRGASPWSCAATRPRRRPRISASCARASRALASPARASTGSYPISCGEPLPSLALRVEVCLLADFRRRDAAKAEISPTTTVSRCNYMRSRRQYFRGRIAVASVCQAERSFYALFAKRAGAVIMPIQNQILNPAQRSNGDPFQAREESPSSAAGGNFRTKTSHSSTPAPAS